MNPPATLSQEARYRYEERLGILGATGQPTKPQHQIALKEALAYEAQSIADSLNHEDPPDHHLQGQQG